MRIFVPYTEIQPATRIALREYRYAQEPVDDYAAYWRDRWREGQTFINVEHDVVPWPGALEALWDCPKLWCAYGYHTNDDFADHYRTLFPYLGCVKFDAQLIAATPGLWDGLDDWLTLDRDSATRLRAIDGLDVHQHFPSVVNANPVLL